MTEYLKQKRIAENAKKYHYSDICKYNNTIIASGPNWNYILRIMSDKSAAVCYIAKPETGCDDGIFCGTDILKFHFEHLKRYENAPRESIIPKDWTITEPGFFEALNIK